MAEKEELEHSTESDQLIAAVGEHTSVELIKPLLTSIDRKESQLLSDTNGFDLLHHGILANHTSFIELLFREGLYKDPHGPLCNSYIHLASKLGLACIVRVLLKERPQDFYWEGEIQRGRVCYPGPCHHSNSERAIKIKNGFSVPQNSSSVNKESGDDENGVRRTAVRFAGMNGHYDCLKILLEEYGALLNERDRAEEENDPSSGESQPPTNILKLACALDSPESVELLLVKEKWSQEALNEALEVSVHGKFSHCMDLLLTHGAEPYNTFQGWNPLHVLFSYQGSPPGGDCDKGIDECTKVLLQHGINVNSSDNPGGYPLNSFIVCLVRAYYRFYNSRETTRLTAHLKTLKMLLQAGADPLFDEISAVPDGYAVAPPRQLYTSTMSAFFHEFCPALHEKRANRNLLEPLELREEFFDKIDWNFCHETICSPPADFLLTKPGLFCAEVCSVLLEYGAKPKCLLMHHVMLMAAHMQIWEMADMSPVVNVFLHYGANLTITHNALQDVPPIRAHPIMRYLVYMVGMFKKAFVLTQSTTLKKNLIQGTILGHYTRLMDSSNRKILAEWAKGFLVNAFTETLHFSESFMTQVPTTREHMRLADERGKEYLCFLNRLFSGILTEPSWLIDLSRLTVWKGMGHEWDAIAGLPVPPAVKTDFYEMIGGKTCQ